MKANPGGQIAPEHVLGRDGLILDIWSTLEQQSVLLVAERRIGKTCLMRKMVAEPASGWRPVFQDLSSVGQAEEFALLVVEQVERHLGVLKKTASRVRHFFERNEIKMPGIPELKLRERSWKSLLVHAIEDLVGEQAEQGDVRLLFLWDEVPYMLENIRRNQGEATALEVLDVLRSIRQTPATSACRFVFTGSIGLHHVLTSLKAANKAAEPVNDMFPITVPPLAPADAEELARRLIAGEGLSGDTHATAAAAETIAREADYVPFYIHHVVRALQRSQRSATPQHAEEVVAEHLVEAADPWELRHYATRIAAYYPGRERLVELILDELACAGAGTLLSVSELLSRLQAQQPVDRTPLLDLLRLMERDHYLVRDTDGRLRFLFPLVGRWWKLDRGL